MASAWTTKPSASVHWPTAATRGCFGRCDFCAQNRSWDGFRKRTAEEVFRDTLTLTRRYHTAHVQFADSVCDTWARRYARMVVEARLYQRSFMDLRAHHPEELWTLLALAGVEDIQIGVEALSAPLAEEARYRRIFEDSPVSLWVEDFSEAKRCVDEILAEMRAFAIQHGVSAVEDKMNAAEADLRMFQPGACFFGIAENRSGLFKQSGKTDNFV